jgi:hypothetical protein
MLTTSPSVAAVPHDQVAHAAEGCAAYVEEHGLNQGSLFGANGSCCTMGVIIEVISEDDQVDWDVALRVEREVRDRMDWSRVDPGEVKNPIAQWNDHPDTTPAEVIGVFTDIAIKHRADAMEVTGD